jgi:iron complex outermembrane receptor protein
VHLTQLPTVVDAATTTGVTGPTTYNPTTGFATRYYDADWQAVTGTAGVEWTPDSDTLVYAKYSRGYKSGGYNIGIFTVLSFFPYTAAEHVDSFELGYKKTWFHNLTTDIAAFYYNYNNLQIPITIVGTAGGLTQASTAFYNVPTAVSRGVELETTWQATKDLAFLFDYSYLDAYSTSGAVVDTADPDAIFPGATPLPCTTATPCTPDSFTGGMQKFQSLAGNRLPNAPRNKIAINANYTFHFNAGALNFSGSYIWRDTQEGALFTRSYNTAPAWDEVDARMTWTGANGHYKVIIFGKNLFNTIGYDAGAYGTRVVGVNDNNPLLGQTASIENQGIQSTYSVTPPRTYGVEIDYKF